MKRRAVIFVSAILLCFVALSPAQAYNLYSESKSAMILTNYSDQLTLLNHDLSAAVDGGSADIASIYEELLSAAQEYHLKVQEDGAGLSYKLMDYDILLKRLKIAVTRYDRRLVRVAELELLAKTGGISQSELSAANEEVSSMYFDIQALLFEISALKSEIESITGERLRDSFDFDSVYLITDALLLGSLNDNVTLSSICIPDGAKGVELPERDYSSDLNSAIEAYYELGAALRELVSAEVGVKTAEDGRRLGQLTAAELNAVVERREDRFLEAAAAKAKLSKALLSLNLSSGGGLISGTSSGEATVLGRTAAENGTGLWLVKRTRSGSALAPVTYPSGTIRANENDNNRYTYSVFYNGRQIGSAICGSDCILSQINYADGVNTATVEFYRNGILTRRTNINIFTPYGIFV